MKKQIVRLAVFELKKRTSNTIFSWLWLLIKPLAYIFCFWFALRIGLRSVANTLGGDEIPYILWLCAGCVPWFFMRDMIGTGANSFKSYAYLVKKIKFPLPVIPSLHNMATFLVQLALQIFLLCVYFWRGFMPDIYLLQVPVLLILMYCFWYFATLMLSVLSAMSKDFRNFLNVLGTPLFWLSGVIFNLHNVQNTMINTALLFNPITFFTECFRNAFCYKHWFWEDTVALGCFAGVFLLTVIVSLLLFKRFEREIADVL